MKTQYLTKKQLQDAVDCPGYIIDYLYNCRKLSIVKESKGSGYQRLYHPNSISIIKDHIERQLIDG